MAAPNRSLGLLVLALWLILYGVASFVAVAIPPFVMGGLAIIAGVLILVGR